MTDCDAAISFAPDRGATFICRKSAHDDLSDRWHRYENGGLLIQWTADWWAWQKAHT